MHAAQLTRAKLMTLAIGIPGGALFYLLHLPLPWMLGAMAATTIAAVSGVRVSLMPRLRLADPILRSCERAHLAVRLPSSSRA